MRLRLEVGLPHKVLMIPEQALGTDQGEIFVYVLDDKPQTKDQPVTVRVKAGVRRGGYVAIEPDEPKLLAEKIKNKEPILLPSSRVIVSGLQRMVKGKKLAPIEAKPPLVPEPPAQEVDDDEPAAKPEDAAAKPEATTSRPDGTTTTTSP